MNMTFCKIIEIEENVEFCSNLPETVSSEEVGILFEEKFFSFGK